MAEAIAETRRTTHEWSYEWSYQWSYERSYEWSYERSYEWCYEWCYERSYEQSSTCATKRAQPQPCSSDGATANAVVYTRGQWWPLCLPPAHTPEREAPSCLPTSVRRRARLPTGGGQRGPRRS